MRTRDWRRARTRAIWRRREGYLNAVGGLVVRETPRRCSCLMCQRRTRKLRAEIDAALYGLHERALAGLRRLYTLEEVEQ